MFQDYNDLLKRMIRVMLGLAAAVFFLLASTITLGLFWLSELLRS